MPPLKRYNAIKDGTVIMSNKTIKEIQESIDVGTQGIRESSRTHNKIKGYYFETVEGTIGDNQIPKPILEDWDRTIKKI